ncbi:MAG: RdgB/HAM1 family non-canonical purine NTP pyrophosphatase [bacterium]
MPLENQKIVIATRNRHKVAEIRAVLAIPGLDLIAAGDWPELPEVEETGATFADNAILKAVSAARASGLIALADDSGLEVVALRNAPGVRSARFAGESADDTANNRKLLELMNGIADRRARFRCVIALANPSGAVQTVDGVCPGILLAAPRGANGFGYDPLFIPDGETLTFAELPAGVKNLISHRARALAAARTAWFKPGGFGMPLDTCQA